MNSAFIMRRKGWRSWAARMLLPALLLIGCVPPGYMPDAKALVRGDLALTLCRVAEPRRADSTGSPVTAQGEAPCPFAMLPVLVTPTAPLALALPLQWAPIMAIALGTVRWKAGAWIVGSGARGPPVG